MKKCKRVRGMMQAALADERQSDVDLLAEHFQFQFHVCLCQAHFDLTLHSK